MRVRAVPFYGLRERRDEKRRLLTATAVNIERHKEISKDNRQAYGTGDL